MRVLTRILNMMKELVTQLNIIQKI